MNERSSCSAFLTAPSCRRMRRVSSTRSAGLILMGSLTLRSL